MVLLRCRHYFCCLSVTFGVFVGANLGLAGGVLVSTVSWIQIAHLPWHPLETRDKISLYIQAVIYTLLAIISLIGMLGSLLRHLRIVSFYKNVLPLHLIFSLASGGFSFFSYFRHAPNDITRCINGSQDQITRALCSKGWSAFTGIVVGLFIFLWVDQMCMCTCFIA